MFGIDEAVADAGENSFRDSLVGVIKPRADALDQGCGQLHPAPTVLDPAGNLYAFVLPDCQDAGGIVKSILLDRRNAHNQIGAEWTRVGKNDP
jgi:hypothetical protein